MQNALEGIELFHKVNINANDRKICKSENEFHRFENTYHKVQNAETYEIEDLFGCKRPCTYNEFKFVNSNPDVMTSSGSNRTIEVAFFAASRKTQIEEEVLLYPFTSLVAEFGGTLGLFLGFSFITIWQEIRGWFGKL